MREPRGAFFVFLMLLAFALGFACNASAQDHCETAIERWVEGWYNTDPWQVLCIQEDAIIWRPIAAGGNSHYRWKRGAAVCVYTTADHDGHTGRGGGRLLAAGNSDRDAPIGGTYWVAEIDHGYWTRAVPGTCESNNVPACSGRCGDDVTPGSGPF